MQTLLNDIELDIQELKCLMQAISSDANPTLKIVAKRNIQQMKVRLEALQELLEEAPTAGGTPCCYYSFDRIGFSGRIGYS